MKQFEYLLANYPQCLQTDKLKELVKKSLDDEIERVLQGNNIDLERRYNHYVENSPSEPENIFEKVDVEKHSDKDADMMEKSQDQENNTDQPWEEHEIHYEKSVEGCRRKEKITAVSG